MKEFIITITSLNYYYFIIKSVTILKAIIRYFTKVKVIRIYATASI